MPGGRVTAHGLLEQDLVAIGGVLRRTARVDGHEHGHEPQADGHEHAPSGASHQRQPNLPRIDFRRARASRSRASGRTESTSAAGRKPTPLVITPSPAANPPMTVPAPRRPEQQVPQQRIQRQGGEEAQHRIDLRAAHHHHELQRAAR